ncbi:MAG: peroxide stress protein YaaA [Acidimicrobiales bacterium]
MLIVLSPAKTLDFESPLPTRKHSLPDMVDESKTLVGVLAKKSPDELGSLMSLSSNLAELNFERFQDWSSSFDTKNARPAVLAFKGDVYMGMDVGRFSERDFSHAQKTIRILSGLHGVLRPLDLMQPYRLEMGTDLINPRGKNLYQFWGDRVTDRLNTDLSARSSKLLVNLASKEYFGVVQPDRLDARIVSPVFLDEKNGNYKIISFFAKKARGSMASWLVMNRAKSAKSITEFDGMGYRYDPDRSTSSEPTFIRSNS